MKKTRVETEAPGMGGLGRICKPNHSLDEGYIPLREYLKQPDIEEKDPGEIFAYVRPFPHEEVVPEMLAWYRSGDLWKVTMALAYFNHSDVLDTIGHLVRQIQMGSPEEERAARRRLSVYGEIGLRKATKLLSAPRLSRP